MTFPNDEDLNGAAIALTRLQDTYNLDTASIARGEIKGIKCRWILCRYNISRSLSYRNLIEWFQFANVVK